MEEWHRRSVLATGAALSVGGLASIGVGASETDDLPNPELDPNPEMADEDWASYRGDAGHARFIPDGYEFDGDLEAAWTVDHDGSVAVADDTVYTTTADGVVALDAADGSLVWENTDVDAGDPAVAGEMVYLNGGDIVAIDREDGSVRWESDLDPGERTSSHTVAYDGVFVVVDGTLYALEADDGSVRWQRDTAVVESRNGDEQESEFTPGPAAMNGVVYAETQYGVLAFDPATGETIWQTWHWTGGDALYATETAVLADLPGEELPFYDAQTGSGLGLVGPYSTGTLGNESVLSAGDYGYGSTSIHGDEYDWELDVTYTYGQAVISGETVYVYFWADAHNYGDRDYDQKLVALDKRDGSEKWTLSKDDAPVGHIRAISGETIYVDHDGELVALREETDADEDGADEDGANGDDEQDDGTEDGDADESDDSDSDDDGRGDADDDGSSGDENTSDNESSNDGGADDESSTDDSADDGSRNESGSSDDGNAGSDDDGSLEDDGDAGSDGENTGTADETENETTDGGDGDDGEDGDDGADDGVPGFTTGTGLVSGALGLEWLRRRVDADEPAE
ncbi:PQQ-binding-like beta-propeller repeat protein [Haloterrigena sp. SYSU A558-1]|uniref:PQQ-binding-like beta-propeller repeat protein n=1 Tax=Haloterrigena gelatinilytica TaxID=2741724 RepID=A0ABX2LHD7_9EURY|nr:PQQ-binding-like beta-propeller repeat protein [Haloterrigena gelatinilytica]